MKKLLVISLFLMICMSMFAVERVVQDFMDTFEEMDELSAMCESADTAHKQAVILNEFNTLLNDLTIRAAALEEKYPNIDEDNYPDGLQDMDKLGERFMISFFTIYAVGADNMEDEEVAAAYSALETSMGEMMGEEDDSWEE